MKQWYQRRVREDILTMNLGNMSNMAKLAQSMLSGLHRFSLEGRVGNEIIVKFKKNPRFSTELYEVKIDPNILKYDAAKVEDLIKTAVNDALSKELQELQKILPEGDKMLRE
eukprot:TRINITY_DN5924_c0_g1_i9.p1 TRINITY_DN5924_c0_g1~~TRINITY_DN5924_c0_g1_i9.p1  ORF type:complete len:112 (-),score=27.57 TRINITY_DN5924_c0_g1_i9:46-381(-)